MEHGRVVKYSCCSKKTPAAVKKTPAVALSLANLAPYRKK
jgi:hypothetical protein